MMPQQTQDGETPVDDQHPSLVVLDRDGVINADSPDYIKSPAEWHALPGSLDAIARLCASGFTVVVATNQSGVGRGLFTEQTLAQIHDEMLRQVSEAGGHIAAVFVCPHAPDAGCDCRKPLPGLMRQIEQQFGTTLQGAPAVGDSARDIDAAVAVTARPILVRTGNGRQTEQQFSESLRPEVFDSLADVADALIGRNS
ncbi:MAG: D-glycero-beta-D-manno-heptose 1,7-bisphosphate 7-phosphatase [Gammaproteobacteria bacterium]|jgi:D-glycero-D-manno-heptose 1,7-bisphosphate phosphatase|nr:D-glycero-beta-D-manno-heptose 1,7-bisphosphate 7-phosphatase [Gammaproteobacteria bacterium]